MAYFFSSQDDLFATAMQRRKNYALVPVVMAMMMDDGSRGDRRSNAGDGSDDGSNRSDDGSTDDDSRTKLRLELRCRLRLR